MARRRTLAVPPDVEPFRRTAEQWAALDAPAWVYHEDAAAEALSAWAVLRYGGGADPGAPVLRWFATRLWLPRCVQPQYLHHADALTDLEHGLWLTDHRSKRGHPGACSVPMLRPDAAVPAWLDCCRQRPPEDEHPREASSAAVWPSVG